MYIYIYIYISVFIYVYMTRDILKRSSCKSESMFKTFSKDTTRTDKNSNDLEFDCGTSLLSNSSIE